MADGKLPVTVRDATGRQAELQARVDDQGILWINPPPPGPFGLAIGPELTALLNTIDLLVDVETKKRKLAERDKS